MVSDEKNLPVEWDVRQNRNIRWVATLGTRTFGNPVVSGGKVFIGTNNGCPRDPKIEGDKGVLMCFAESDGRFLWQAVHDKLVPTEAHDWPDIGICSIPCVVADRLYYVSNRGELVCLDTEGFADDENDGPFADEQRKGRTDADIVWKLDMVTALGVRPYQASASSPLVVGDRVFVVTGNGIDPDQEKVPAPQAPSFIAVNRLTGQVVWADNSPGEAIREGQWSSPAWGVVRSQTQVVFPGGDGWLYAFEPTRGKPLWKFDSTPRAAQSKFGAGLNHPVATPVCCDDKVFVAVGQNPESGKGPGGLWAIDATRTGDITRSGVVWEYGGKDFGRSISTVAVCDGLLYAAELRGYLHCLEARTGKVLWRHDLGAPAWSSPLVADGKVYIPNEDGDVWVLEHARQAKVLKKNAMNESVHSTVTAANGTLFIATQTRLYAVGGSSPPPTTATTTTRTDAPWAIADWPMFRGNPHLTGVASGELPIPLKIGWKFEAPDAVESSPAIVGASVYFGCDDGVFRALSLADGSVQWTYVANAPIRSSPCLCDGAVLFGDDRGVFHAVDARSGKKRWTFSTKGQINSSPNMVGKRVLFGSYDNHLYCLSVADGTLIWKCRTEDKVHGTAGIGGDYALVAGCDGHLHVIHLDDGRAIGSIPMGALSGAAAAVRGTRVFVGTFGNQVLAIDWTTQRIAWTYAPTDPQQPFYASAAVTDDLVIVGGRDHLVHALDARTGKARWTFATKGRIDASPVIVGNRAVVGSMDGNVYVLDVKDGKGVWTFDAASPMIASPAVGRGRVVVATEDGMIYCLVAGG